MVLDTDGGPFNLSPSHGDGPGNFQHPVIVVDAARGEFHPTGLFYFLGHFSKFVGPGAVRIGVRESSLPDHVSAVAFEAQRVHGGGTFLQLVNRGSASQRVTVCASEGVVEVPLPAKSITTARWS
eukprot:7189165-Prymnesium_polylepis.1